MLPNDLYRLKDEFLRDMALVLKQQDLQRYRVELEDVALLVVAQAVLKFDCRLRNLLARVTYSGR